MRWINRLRGFKTRRTFTDKAVKDHLVKVCENNNYILPCKLDSWHGFESKNPKALNALGKYLERKHDWRNTGSWEVQLGNKGVYHLRVAKEGIYTLEKIQEEIPFMEKVASEFGVESYVDCAPQPTLPNIG